MPVNKPVNVIVGGGQAGARAARAMREAGFIGEIHIFGEERHLPYERPPLSKTLLKDPGSRIPVVLSEEDCQALAIQAHTGKRIAAVDVKGRSVEVEGGGRVAFDRLLFATGSRLRELRIAGLPADRLHYLRDLDDCRRLASLPSQDNAVAVIGAGFIGLEVAATLNQLGCAITVVEMSDEILPRLGCPPASRQIRQFHEAQGIRFRLGRAVLSADAGTLTLDDGSQVAADHVVAGIGVVPNTELAENAGVKVDNGILTDEYGRTSAKGIFATGDVARYLHRPLGRQVRLESWHSANEQSAVVGKAMAGSLQCARDIPWVWSDQGELNLQVAGHPAKVDEILVRGADESSGTYLQLCDSRLVGAVTVNRGQDMTPLRRILTAAGTTALPVREMADAAIPLRKFVVRS